MFSPVTSWSLCSRFPVTNPSLSHRFGSCPAILSLYWMAAPVILSQIQCWGSLLTSHLFLHQGSWLTLLQSSVGGHESSSAPVLKRSSAPRSIAPSLFLVSLSGEVVPPPVCLAPVPPSHLALSPSCPGPSACTPQQSPFKLHQHSTTCSLIVIMSTGAYVFVH